MNTPKPSNSWWNTLNRATQRGDYDRAAELYAVPVEERPTWKASEHPKQQLTEEEK